MNKQRRKELYAIESRLDMITGIDKEEASLDCAREILEDVKCDLKSVLLDEEYYMNSIPENLQGSSRYDAAEEACDNLESAIDSIDNAINSDDFNEMIDAIEEAVNFIDDATV